MPVVGSEVVESPGQRRGGGFRRQSGSVEQQVRRGPVQRLALRLQLRQPLHAVGSLQQRAGGIVLQARQLGGGIHLQVDDDAGAPHRRAVGLRQHRAATGGDDRGRLGQHRCQHARLVDAKAGLPLGLEQRGDAAPRFGLDAGVHVHERPLQPRGQRPAQRALARPHRADQDEMFAVLHRSMLTAPAGAPITARH